MQDNKGLVEPKEKKNVEAVTEGGLGKENVHKRLTANRSSFKVSPTRFMC